MGSSLLSRDQTLVPCTGSSRVLATGIPGKFLPLKYNVHMNQLGISPQCRFWFCAPDKHSVHFALRWSQCSSEGGKTLDDNYSQIRKILLLAHHLFSWRMGVASSVRWESQAKKKNLRICFGQEYSSGYWSQELISEKWIFFSWSNDFTKCCITLTLWRPKIYRAKGLRSHPVEKLVWFSVAPSPLPI